MSIVIKTVPVDFEYAGKTLTASVSIGFRHAFEANDPGMIHVEAVAAFEGFTPSVVNTEAVAACVEPDVVARIAGERGLAERAVDHLKDNMKLTLRAMGVQCICKGGDYVAQ